MSKQARKPLKWIGSAKRDLDSMPEDVKDLFGHAIDLAQAGGKHQDAKALSGFGSAGVLEVVEDFRSDTYRAVYTVKFAGWSMFCIASRRSPRVASKRPRRIWI
jgi:phage-related protein